MVIMDDAGALCTGLMACMLQNASEFQTWKSRPQLIHMQYAMLNEASGASDTSRIAKWQSIVVRPACPCAQLPAVLGSPLPMTPQRQLPGTPRCHSQHELLSLTNPCL